VQNLTNNFHFYSDEDNEDVSAEDRIILNSVKQKLKGKSTKLFKDGEKLKSQKARYFAGTTQTSKQTSNTGLGEWEKHTTGIGSKLLMQVFICINNPPNHPNETGFFIITDGV
jgi:hypothetical protein